MLHSVAQLVAEADFSAIDGEQRRSLLRDVQFLRDELARPPERWRAHVIHTVLGWIEESVPDAARELPSVQRIRTILKNDHEN